MKNIQFLADNRDSIMVALQTDFAKMMANSRAILSGPLIPFYLISFYQITWLGDMSGAFHAGTSPWGPAIQFRRTRRQNCIMGIRQTSNSELIDEKGN